ANSSGSAKVDGLWYNVSSLTVGNNGTGALIIGTTGTVRNNAGNIGNTANSFGSATVAGLWNNIGALTVGVSGTGVLAISGSGTVLSNGAAVIGSGAGSSGTASVGGLWDNAGSVSVGVNGIGALTIENTGTLLTHDGAVGIGGNNSSGTGVGAITVHGVLISDTRGGGSNGRFYVGNSGTGSLHIASSGTVINGSGLIGNSDGSSGTASVDGVWYNVAGITVGNNGAGALTIETDGTVRNTTANIGAGATGTGAVIVHGLWENNNAFTVGNQGAGTLDIENDGIVRTTNGGALLGASINSSGSATIHAGGLWENSGGAFTIASRGAGVLTIENGGTLRQTGNTTLGTYVEGTGTVVVRGFFENTGNLTISNAGAGIFDIAATGIVRSGSAPTSATYLGYEATGSGTAFVRGLWNIGGNFISGRSGASGHLAIIGSGSVTLARAYTQNATATLTFDLTGADGRRGAFLSAQSASLSGTVAVVGYAPVTTGTRAGELSQVLLHSDDAISGDFDARLLPDLSSYSSPFSFVGSYGLFVRDNRDYLIGARLLWHSGTAIASGTFDLAAGRHFDVDVPLDDQAAPGAFDTGWDGRSLTKTGAGLLTLSATNTYTGDTTIHAGTLAITGHAGGASGVIAATAGGTAAAVVSGHWANAAFLRVGQRGAGALDVLSSGSVSASNVYLGDGAGARGAVTVAGGGQLQSHNRFLVGHSGVGTLDIQAGASVIAGGDEANAYESALGYRAGASGSAHVAGLWSSSYFYVGKAGKGVLDIAAGGTVVAGQGFIGSGFSGSGTARVSGLWENSGDLGVGDFGAGRLDILPTGTVIARDSTLGIVGSGAARVAGLWQNNGNLRNGVDGAGILSLASTGTVNIAGAYTQNAQSALHLDFLSARDAYINAGSATISGSLSATLGTVNYAASSQLPAPRTFLRTASGITGTFTDVSLTNANTPDYLVLRAAVVGNDYQLGLGLSWEAAGAGAHGTFTLDNGQSFTLDTALADQAGNGLVWDGKSLAKQGAGTLTLSSGNTYSGTTTIHAGKLIATAAAALGSSRVVNHAALEFAPAADGVFAGAIAGSGSFAKTGAARLTLTGASFAAATASVTGGTLSLGDAAHAVAATVGSFDVAAGAGLVMGRDSTLAVSGTLAFGGNATLDFIVGGGTGPAITAADVLIGAGATLNIAGIGDDTVTPFTLLATTGSIANQFTTSIGGGGAAVDYLALTITKSADAKSYLLDASLIWNQPDNSRAGAFTIDAGATFTVDTALADRSANPATNWDGQSLAKQGAGTLILSAANTYTGSTAIHSGTLRLAAANAIAASTAVDIADGAALEVAAGAQTLQNITGEGAIRNAGAITFASAVSTTYSGIISGAGGIEKSGEGTLTLSGGNTYAGATTINAGKLIAANPAALGAGPVVNNSALEFALVADGAFAGSIAGSGTFARTGGSMLTLTGASFAAGAASVTGGTLSLGDATHAIAATVGSFDVAARAGLVMGRDSTLAVTHTLALGDGSTLDFLIGAAPGPLITAGDVSIGAGVTLNLAGITAGTEIPITLISATTGGIANEFATTIGGTSAAADYITVTAFKTADAKSLLLDAALTWNQDDATRHGNFTIGEGGSFTLGQALADNAANPATGWDGQSLAKQGAGTLVLTAANTYSGTTFVNDGVLQIGGGGNTGSVAGAIVNNAALVFERSDAASHAGVISGAGNLYQQGAGTLTLTADNNYTGTTFVEAGALQVDGAVGGAGIVNSGTLATGAHGRLTAQVNNLAGALFTHTGTLAAPLVNAGIAASSGFIGGAVDNTGDFANSGQLDAVLNNRAHGVATNAAGALVSGSVINAADALFTNSGTLAAPWLNSGSAINTPAGIVSGPVANDAGATMENLGRIHGALANAGDFTNTGALTAALVNTGTVTHSAGSLASVDNRAGAVFTAAGSALVTGRLVNAGLATVGDLPGGVTNSGTLRLADASAAITFAGLANAGLVEIGAHTQYAVLDAGTISGAGRYVLPVNSDTGEHSTLVFAAMGGSDLPTLVINAAGGGIQNAAAVLNQSVIGPGVENFIVENFDWGLVEYGGGINADGTWYFDNMGYSAAGALAGGIVSLHHDAWTAQQHNLSRHMDGLRFARGLQPGSSANLLDSVWAVTYGQRLDADRSIVGRKFHQDTFGLLVGTDHDWRLGAEGRGALTLGIYLGYTCGTLTLDRDSSGAGHEARLRGTTGGVYAGWVHATGFYADATLNLASASNRLETDDVRADFSQWDVGGSLAVGRKFALGRGWFVDPQAQFACMRYLAKNYTLGPDALRADDFEAVQLRVGARFGRAIQLAGGGLWQPYLRLDGVDVSTGGGEVRDAAEGIRADIEGSRFEIGGGVLWQLSLRHQLRLDYEAGFGSHYDTPWSLTAGFLHRF
ncbi:MAG: autotransporter-associated beta strand repeat-containing protein, partial [Opitutaceae bacterium]|nr:autotransporter-associated beta strand repeat-containing protein [Opitutaceae bacterium]